MPEVRTSPILLLAGAILLSASARATVRKDVIAHGRDLLRVSTADVWRNRGKFAAVGCDGVLMTLDRTLPGGSTAFGRDVLGDGTFHDAEFEESVRLARECLASDGLRKSLALVSLVPAERLAWTDNKAWMRAADNVGCYARAARKAGFGGLAINKGLGVRMDQFRCLAGDPDLAEARRLARERGRLFFGSLFRAFPDAKVLSLCLFDVEQGELWVPFLNGLLDVIPPTARLVDGNAPACRRAVGDADGYRALASRTTGDARELVAPENRAKYAVQVSVGFGLSVDAYDVTGEQDRRRFLRNLTDAASQADELVWIYGKRGTLIDWDAKGGEELREPTWESQFDGYARALRTAGGDLVWFREGLQRGELRKLALEVRKGDAVGAFAFTNKNRTQRYTVGETLCPGDVVYVRFREKGRYPHLALTWKSNEQTLLRRGSFEARNEELIVPAAGTSDDDWRWIDVRFVVPEGADGLGLLAWGPLAHRHPLAFDAIECYRLSMPLATWTQKDL